MKTRDRILEAFFTLVAEHGYEKTTLSMICKTLNINKPSIYYCFKSKEDMLITMFDEYVSNYFILDFKVLDGLTYKESLIIFGHDIIDVYEANPDLISLSLEYYTQAKRIEGLHKKVKAFQEQFSYKLESIVCKGVELGEFEVDIKLNAQILVAILISAEMSLSYDLGLQNKRIWQTTIDNLYLGAL